MIHGIIQLVASELNTTLKQKHNVVDDQVVVSNIVQQDGTLAAHTENKIVLSVVNVAPEFKSHPGRTSIGYAADKNLNADPAQNAPLNYEFDILVAASFAHHVASLKFLADAIDFFYRKPVFTPANSTQLSSGIEKVVFEGINLTYAEKQNLWTTLGAKYIPSVLFRVKIIHTT
jgi:hypothetical protein